MLAQNDFTNDQIDPDMRRHERVPLALFGHYMRANDAVIPCFTTDLSQSGIALSAQGGEIGEQVTLHLNGIGELDGEIVRSFEGGFAIALHILPERQADLTKRIHAIYENSALSLIEMPLLEDARVDSLFDSIMLDAQMTRGAQRLSGETSGRFVRGAQGAELEFRCTG
ncbi:MAG: hypothetical protein RJB09_1623 [Pseudomonadota bacterium]